MGKNKILVVDDQIGIRLLLKEVLKNEGYEIEEATTGKEALDQLNTTAFDLMILDYKLPIMDGTEVLEKLEKDNVEIPAIVMSGLVENIASEARKYKLVKSVIAKPFNINEFVEKVHAIVGNRTNMK
ncbi:response regulator [Oceanobacillus sp. Castelsardo]|uniref:response regulator n=1 Tax=Oceanobacillus sp. Castelsardo TaxID=1851204 RepID=UPI0008396F19|nr:response regulator [Oceanobacillus sp. Castelsardo]